MNILKTLFGVDRNGRWAIRDLLTVPLEPKDGQVGNFYAVAEDILVTQSNYIGTIRHAMGQSIVPIVSESDDDSRITCLGTGFFISTTGLLITAAHVLGHLFEQNEKRQDNKQPAIGAVMRNNPIFEPKGFKVIPLEWALILGNHVEHPLPFMPTELKLTTDIALCKFASLPDAPTFQPLSIIQPGIRGVGIGIGKRATAIGYGSMEHLDLDEETGAVLGKGHFDLHVSEGTVIDRFPDNGHTAAVPSPGACFTASLRLPSGMSGSPIFDDEGIYVHGVASRGAEGESFGYGAMLAEFLPVPIGAFEGKTLSELLASPEHGMPKLYVAGA